MTLTCPHCGGLVRPKLKKLAVVAGGTALVAAMGASLCTPVGRLAVIPAAWAGSANAQKILHAKLRFWQASKQAGSFFICHKCEKDVSMGEIFAS